MLIHAKQVSQNCPKSSVPPAQPFLIVFDRFQSFSTYSTVFNCFHHFASVLLHQVCYKCIWIYLLVPSFILKSVVINCCSNEWLYREEGILHYISPSCYEVPWSNYDCAPSNIFDWAAHLYTVPNSCLHCNVLCRWYGYCRVQYKVCIVFPS